MNSSQAGYLNYGTAYMDRGAGILNRAWKVGKALNLVY